MFSFEKELRNVVNLFEQGESAAAEQACRGLMQHAPRDLNLWRLLGLTVRKSGLERVAEAQQILEQGIEYNPASGLLYFELGNVFVDQHQGREAFRCFQKAIELKPNLQQAYVNSSAVLEEQERFQESLAWARQAAALNEKCPLAHYNIANALRELGRLEEAVQHYEKSIRYNPDFPKAHWNLGICHLLLGNYEKGWKLFETRGPSGEVSLDRYAEPAWDGSPLANKTILVHAEQGIGDEIIFASCYHDLLKVAQKCILVCEPRLFNLYRRSFPQARVYGYMRLKNRVPPPIPEPFDVQVAAGSLPHFFRNAREQFAQTERFLIADPLHVARWRAEFAALGHGYKIGLSWRAGGKPAERRKRSIPLSAWRELLLTPGVQFVNLQYSDAADEIAAVETELGIKIHDWEAGDPLIDMDQYAAKIAALDLVISVGNATVHMAGALGTPAWAMLPRIPSWRWMAHGDYSPWYQSVRLFRQAERGAWQPVLEQVGDELRRKLELPPLARSEEGPESDPPMHFAEVGEEAAEAEDWLTVHDFSPQGALDQLPLLTTAAQEAYHAKQFEQAESLYRQVLQLQPRHPVALYGLGLCARATGRPELAIRSLQRSLAVYPQLPEHHFQLGLVLFESHRLDEAERSLLEAIRYDAQHAAAYNLLGAIYFQDQRWDEAATVLLKAIKAKPHFAPAHSNLGRLMLQTGHVEESIVCFQRALGANENYFDALLHLGIAYEQLAQPQAALRIWRQAARLAPADPEVRIRLAKLLKERGKFEEALEMLDAAIQIQPRHAPALELRAQILRELGEAAPPVLARGDNDYSTRPERERIPAPAEPGPWRAAAEDLLNFNGRATDCQEKRLPGPTSLSGPHWPAELQRDLRR